MPQWAGLPKASDSPIELSGWYALAMDKSWNRLPRAAQQFLCWFLYRTSVPTWVASHWKADDTLKSLQIIPIDIPAMLLSKILLVLIFSAALYLILFLSAFIVEAILHVQVLSVGLFGRYLTMYCVEGLSVFIATLPVICIVIKTGQDYWMGLLIAEIYSFITIFVGNLGTVSKLYPIIAALTLSGYYESNYIEKLLSLLSMIACLLFSAFLIKEYSKKME